MRLAHNFVGIEAMLNCPAVPDALYGVSGIDQNAIQINKQGSAVDFNPSDSLAGLIAGCMIGLPMQAARCTQGNSDCYFGKRTGHFYFLLTCP